MNVIHVGRESNLSFKSDGLGDIQARKVTTTPKKYICEKCGSIFYQKYAAKYCRVHRCK